MDEIKKDTDLAAERIASPLRAPERLAVGFEDRLLGHIRAEALDVAARKTERPRSWWTAPRTITRAPIVSMALAAGFAAIVALSTFAAVRSKAGVALFTQKT